MGDVPSPSPSSTDDSSATGPSSEDHAKKANSFQGDVVVVPNDGARAIVGKGMTSLSELINENIVAARYGTFATIALLTVSLMFPYYHIVLFRSCRVPRN